MTLLRKPLAAVALFLAVPFATSSRAQLATATRSPAALVQPRLQGAIDSSSRATLLGSHPLVTRTATDLGPVDASMTLHGISLVFSRTAAQEAALQTLLAAQQNINSPLYHQWLTPDQYAAQFGVAASDIAATQTWLQQQGFTIDSVARSQNRIVFSGSVAAVQTAFGTTLHNFRTPDGTTHFAPSTDLALPAALSSLVLTVDNLSSFRLHPQIIRNNKLGAQFTSFQTGNHYFGPGDIATMYDVKPLYQAGYTGANQSIAVVGQSFVYLSDVTAFQNAAGIAAKTPILILVPNSGTPTPYEGDETESDLDLEYSSTIAPGAQVYLIYTGSSANYGVFNSIEYAIDERVAPIVTASYGECEPLLGASNQAALDQVLSQGAAQGQTIIASAGDQGSTACYGSYTSTDIADNAQVAVDYPGSSVYATAIGGTEVPTASAAAANSTYWNAATTADVISSVKSYIPEQAWNDDVAAYQEDLTYGDTFGPASGGGGVSIYEGRPTWQTGVTVAGAALPAGNYRLVPDISMVASPFNAPLLYCTSDESSWESNQKNSCNLGFRDSVSQDLTVAGGTSFDAPIFAGMMALLNQATNSTGQGLVNPTLYSLASNPTTYASAFHDTTLAGGNQCSAGSSVCGTGAAVTDYATATGYDQATGLGSIDLYNLYTAWPKPASAALAASTTTIAAATTLPALGAADTITLTVAPVTGTVVPAGSVTLTVDSVSVGTFNLSATGSATYTFTSTVYGAHTLVATYTGSSTFASSTSTAVINIYPPGNFTLTANPSSLTIAPGSTGTVTVSAIPSGGYTGTINIVGLSYPSALTNFCLSDQTGGVLTITGTGAATDTITFYTSATTCNKYGLTILHSGTGGKAQITRLHAGAQPPAAAPSPYRKAALPTALACLLLTFGLGRRSRGRRSLLARAGLSLAAVAILSLAGLGLTACSSSAAPSSVVQNSNLTGAGTYPFVILAGDSVDALLSSQTTVTVTVN